MHVIFPAASEAFQIGPVSIHWYGLLVVVGIFAGYLICRSLAFRVSFLVPREKFDTLFFWLVIWGFIGGRLYHVLNEPAYYWNHPFDVVKIWNGGLAIHGAIIAGVIVVYYFSLVIARSETTKQSQFPSRNSEIAALSTVARNDQVVRHFFILSDLLVIGLALGQAIGRWGNYFNQELFGKPTEGLFKVFIDATHRPAGFETIAYYHPTFLYESMLNFVLFVVLFLGYRRYRVNRTGLTTSWYLVGYGLIRFFIDFLRIDPRPFLGGLYLSQWVSLGMIAVGIVVWYTIVSQQKTKNSEQ